MARPAYQLRAGHNDSFRLYRDADSLGVETFRQHEAAGYYLDSTTLEELAFLTFSDLVARAGVETPYVDDLDHGRERFGDGFADGYRRGVSTSTREGLQLRKGLGLQMR